MKALIPLLIVLTSACASRKVPTLQLHHHPESTGVRFGEIIGRYHLGRQVDPTGHLHEAHPIYRIEAEASWDLRPGLQGLPLLERPAQPDAAYSPAPIGDAIVAELRHQQDATARVLQEASQLGVAFQALQPVISDMARVAREHSAASVALRELAERQKRLEDELRRLISAPSGE